MQVHVRYFAALRETTGLGHEDISLPATATVADARAALLDRYPALAPLLGRCAVALNRAYASIGAPLTEGDELAFLPPVGGG